MDDNLDLEIIKAITEFPIGDVAKSQHELLCKASIVSFLAPFQEQFFLEINGGKDLEAGVKNCLRDVFMLNDDEIIPDVSVAEIDLDLPVGFIQDDAKVQQIKADNPQFGKAYNLISNHMKETLCCKKYTK